MQQTMHQESDFLYQTSTPFGMLLQEYSFQKVLFHIAPIPSRLTAEKMARTDALVILELTPTP